MTIAPTITYIGHACLHLAAGDATIVFDPWLDGPAYAGQWNIFPKPVDRTPVDHAQVVMISHGHEDHLHEATLQALAKDKRLFYPYYWYGGTVAYLRELGFRETIEAASGKTYALGPTTFATFIVNGQDSLIVIEADGQVIVNANDALHSSDARIIDLYTDIVKRRWPRIDVLFCGFGGASYFPNVFHGPGKDDRAIGRLREQLYVHNFCRIVQRLAPALAVPFAADFVLLDPAQRWINDTRFLRERIAAYYRQNFATGRDDPDILVLYPGDRLVGRQLEAVSPYRAEIAQGHRPALIARQYPVVSSAFAASSAEAAPDETTAATLAAHLAREARYYGARLLHGLQFSLGLRGGGGSQWFAVSFAGVQPTVTRAVAETDAPIAIETTAAVLRAAVSTDWGGDGLIIGYACEVRIKDRRAAGKARIAVELLTRYPRPAAYARRHPLRAARYLAQSWPAMRLRLANRLQRLAGRDAVASKRTMASADWLTGDADLIRQANGLPTEERAVEPA